MLTGWPLNSYTSKAIKTDVNGNVISAYSFLDSVNFTIGNFSFMNDSIIFSIGSFVSPVTSSTDGFLLETKVFQNGCSIDTSIAAGGIPFSSTIIPVSNYNITSPVQDTIIPLYSILDTISFTLYDLCNSTNINEHPNYKNEISIFPNPATSTITIQYNLTTPKETSVSVFNIYGQIVETQNIASLPAGKHEITIDMKDLEQGIYFVKINAGGKIETRKIVKM